MTRHHALAGTHTIRGIQQMLGLSRGVITGLIDSGFVAPSRGPRNEYRFTFQDVVLMRTAVELQSARIAPRKILSALRKLRARLPAEMPLSGLRITAVGNDVTVRDAHARWQAESGQLVMDFELTPVGGGTVSLLQRKRPAAAASTSEDEPRVEGGGGRAGKAGGANEGEGDGEGEAIDASDAFSLGEALEASHPRDAEAAYRKALALDPGHADAYLNLGALLCETKRCGEAVALYDEALRRHPDQSLLHFNRAIALEDQGRPADALAAYNACLRLDPDLADAHYNAARLHEQLGDAKKAVRHFSAYRRLLR